MEILCLIPHPNRKVVLGKRKTISDLRSYSRSTQNWGSGNPSTGPGWPNSSSTAWEVFYVPKFHWVARKIWVIVTWSSVLIHLLPTDGSLNQKDYKIMEIYFEPSVIKFAEKSESSTGLSQQNMGNKKQTWLGILLVMPRLRGLMAGAFFFFLPCKKTNCRKSNLMNGIKARVEHQHECGLHRHFCENNIFGVWRPFWWMGTQ